MDSKDVLILILVIVLAYLYFFIFGKEGFITDPSPMLCSDNPLNSNCQCSSDEYVQAVDGPFPRNYGQTAPYYYKCVNSTENEPPTTLW